MHGLMHLHDDGSDRESMTVHSSSSLSDLAATSHMIYSFFSSIALSSKCQEHRKWRAAAPCGKVRVKNDSADG